MLLQAPHQAAGTGERPEVDRYLFGFHNMLYYCGPFLTIYDMLSMLETLAVPSGTPIVYARVYTRGRLRHHANALLPHGHSDHEPLNSQLYGVYLTRELLILVRSDAGGNDRPCDSARTTEGSLGCNEDVRHVL